MLSILAYMIFNPQFTIENINRLSVGCMLEHLGIEITAIGEDSITGKMPVDQRTKQPYGLLHGGASVVLAESLGSIASSGVVDLTSQTVVGLEINANHLKSATSGFVTGKAKPIHLGKRTHVWDIRITNENNQLVCISRFTVAVIDKK
ncbi:MAG: hotdog fold thioesterase [Cyclobacteriaceae bacterium]